MGFPLESWGLRNLHSCKPSRELNKNEDFCYNLIFPPLGISCSDILGFFLFSRFLFSHLCWKSKMWEFPGCTNQLWLCLGNCRENGENPTTPWCFLGNSKSTDIQTHQEFLWQSPGDWDDCREKEKFFPLGRIFWIWDERSKENNFSLWGEYSKFRMAIAKRIISPLGKNMLILGWL